MNGIDFIISQSNCKPLPAAPRMTPPGGGKLSVSQTADIVARFAAGEKKADLAREYGVSIQGICYVIQKQK
ncbi:hypothetical protein H0A66_02880 [Alcaligenaceae bacterium]|nr:hypothetical protein [Alcaligenaceae bacterium]